MADAVAKLAEALREAEVSCNRFLSGFIELGTRMQEALESSLGQAIEGLITGTGSLKDTFKSFARDVVSSFSQIAGKNIIRSILGDPDGARSGLGGIFGALFKGRPPGLRPGLDSRLEPGRFPQLVGVFLAACSAARRATSASAGEKQ